MTPEERQQMVMTYEGQTLSNAGHFGTAHGAEHARCAIDGIFNALILMEGAEEAATFAFALSDRVVGRLRTPTPWPAIAAAPIAAAAAVEPKQPQRTMTGLGYVSWLYGFAAGLIVGSTAT